MQYGFEDQINRALGIFEHKNNVREHYYCVKEIFEMYKTPEQLQKLAARPDLDTVCAYDYVRMKKEALQGEALTMKDWHPELRGIKQIPKFGQEAKHHSHH